MPAAQFEVVKAPEAVRGTVRLPGVSVSDALGAWTDAARLHRWWGGELTADLRPGGRYEVAFPQLEQLMAGTIMEYDPGGVLRFSWAWAHEPSAPVREVSVRAETTADGCRIELTHGPYGDGPGEDEHRDSHHAGWAYFLPRLARELGCE